ncbi:hypothetical protein B0H16DRAFT_1448814 [Mycena metata]|uniref:Uncharacterized protein n=1 Tax=Mycena metata TaxID=1033252 RepID=A0AAD7K713_9AGAR|nr:hypothetical protein B0H16DRAFT_1448814 [Mycena metata]
MDIFMFSTFQPEIPDWELCRKIDFRVSVLGGARTGYVTQTLVHQHFAHGAPIRMNNELAHVPKITSRKVRALNLRLNPRAAVESPVNVSTGVEVRTGRMLERARPVRSLTALGFGGIGQHAASENPHPLSAGTTWYRRIELLQEASGTKEFLRFMSSFRGDPSGEYCILGRRQLNRMKQTVKYKGASVRDGGQGSSLQMVAEAYLAPTVSLCDVAPDPERQPRGPAGRKHVGRVHRKVGAPGPMGTARAG